MTTNSGPEKESAGTGGKEQRPYATLDLQASEISSRDPAGETASTTASTSEAPPSEPHRIDPPADDAPAGGSGGGALQFASHMAAGVLGALIALIIAYYSTLPADETPLGPSPEVVALQSALGRSEQRIAALEKSAAEAASRADQFKAAAAEGDALKQQLAALSDRVGRVESRPDTTGLSPEAVQDTLNPLSAKLAEVESRLTDLAKAQTELQTNSRAAALGVALYNLRRAASEGRPYAVELRSVADMSPVALELEALNARRDQGIPNVEQLTASFQAAANAALDAENAPAEPSLIGDLWAKAKSFVRIRRKGDVPGDDTLAILARIEHRLTLGELDAALAEGEQLKGPAATALAPWLDGLKAKRAADDALARVEAQLLTALGREDQGRSGG